MPNASPSIPELRARLASIPEVVVEESAVVARLIDQEVASLGSDEAMASVELDTYWPKWGSPWWSMSLLEELGAADRIPARIVDAMVQGLEALPLHVFPIHEHEWPPGADRKRHASCHCAIGNIDRVLTACGVDVDRVLPWFLPWYSRYQMADGGLNCDDSAYLVTHECASSMVGTIAPFEAMLRRGPSEFCDRAAAFLIARELRLGSPTEHNAEERAAAPTWLAPCFPRFYFYDVLRGASALVRWATAHARTLPIAAIAPAMIHLAGEAADGVVRIGRRAYAGKQTHAPDAAGAWVRIPAREPELVHATSVLGAPSPALTRQWATTRRALIALIDAGQLTS